MMDGWMRQIRQVLHSDERIHDGQVGETDTQCIQIESSIGGRQEGLCIRIHGEREEGTDSSQWWTDARWIGG